jgi:hypothetical protein
MRILTYITATLLLLIPGAAIAQYVTPEELYDQTVNGSTVPRNPRQAKQAAAAQESKASTSSKPTLQEWWLHSSEEPSNTPQDTPNQNIQESSTPTLETSPSQIEEENTLKENGTITLDPIENRRQERIEQLGGEWLAPSATDTLHSTALTIIQSTASDIAILIIRSPIFVAFCATELISVSVCANANTGVDASTNAISFFIKYNNN